MCPSDLILSLNEIDVDGLLDFDDVDTNGSKCSLMLSVIGSISIAGVSFSPGTGRVVMDGTGGFVSAPLLPCCKHLMRSLKDTFRGLATGDKAAVDVVDELPGVLIVGDVGLKLCVTEGELDEWLAITWSWNYQNQ